MGNVCAQLREVVKPAWAKQRSLPVCLVVDLFARIPVMPLPQSPEENFSGSCTLAYNHSVDPM